MNTCKVCKWWFAKEKAPMGTSGDCRRYAPRRLLLGDSDGYSRISDYLWPQVKEYEFCGEFEDRVERG